MTERIALGTWCFKNDGSISFGKTQDKLLAIGCRYFDEEGVLWGEALKSSGPLLLVDEFRAYLTGDYYLSFSTEFDVATQVKVLKIFLNNQSEDFNPEYIDLRIEGRVYYK